MGSSYDFDEVVSVIVVRVRLTSDSGLCCVMAASERGEQMAFMSTMFDRKFAQMMASHLAEYLALPAGATHRAAAGLKAALEHAQLQQVRARGVKKSNSINSNSPQRLPSSYTGKRYSDTVLLTLRLPPPPPQHPQTNPGHRQRPIRTTQAT